MRQLRFKRTECVEATKPPNEDQKGWEGGHVIPQGSVVTPIQSNFILQVSLV